MASAGGARVGDAERQAVVDLLRHHTGAGRLTLDEFAERAGEAYAAITRADLDKVVADLPDGVRPEPARTTEAARPPVPATAGDQPPPQPGAGRVRRWFVAIMGGSETRGPWHAPDDIVAFAFWGGVDIDLRNALIESSVVEIEAWAIMGGITITVPEGIPVEISGFVLMGGTENRARSAAPIPGAPVIRVKARGMWGGITVRNPRVRRERGHRRHRHDSTSESREPRDEPVSTPTPAPSPELTTGSTADQIPDVESELDWAGVPTGPPSPPPPPQPFMSAPPMPPTPPTPGPGPRSTESNGSSVAGSVSRVGSEVPSGTLTILISDITGSTQHAERLGDQVWLELLRTHNAIVRGRLAEYGGTEIKAVGDGFLVVFPSARSAVLAAIAIQRAMADYRARHPEQGVELRVGLHTGEVVTSDGDIFGHNVVVASRIADAAAPGEILVSRLTRDLTASASDLGFDGGEEVDLKGVSEPWRVHRVVWE